MMDQKFNQHMMSYKWLLVGTTAILTVILVLLMSDKAFAHGYIEGPASRGYLCKTGQNTNCGPIVYEPQSLEGPKGFPAAGPADGKLASAGLGGFDQLNAQSSTRWTKVNMSSGTVTFNWKLTAAHATTKWEYFITKPNWDPNAPLSRAQFDLTPFCSVNTGGARPPFNYSDTCNVPQRTGYHVILAVWTVHDTPNAFYNVIDANFGGGSSDTTPPTAPSSLAVTGKTSNTVSLSWNAATDNVGVSQYKIYNGSSLVTSISGSNTSYTVTGLTANTSYTFSVVAVDGAGNSSVPSGSIAVTTNPAVVDVVPPTAPSNLHVMGSPTSNSVPLMWTASSDNVGVTGYKVYNGTNLVATVSGSATSYTVTGLAASTSYTFTVYAVDGANNQSPASNSVSATTAQPPAAVPWAANTAYTVGQLVYYNGATYECRQPHTSLVGWEPTAVPALWKLVP
ncbi:lytic polysaccharide monooxygenase [Paenibacillus arenosi]